MKQAVPAADIERVIDAALAEDIGAGDVTSDALLPPDSVMNLVMRARQEIVVAGIDVALAVFRRLAPDADIKVVASDGDRAQAGAELMRLDGPARGLLTAERTALNLVQLLSGIATMTRQYVDAIDGTGAVLLDTRKTIPGLRSLSKYATRMG
ncbi:MAG: nicotinate-nucleotide diphosphorylase (carboxylating), partial [Proteobacteria bacterium]|nr:nicotinate-nucleotide diphosphorylase (carboxylating) [Pseudomonadota bacterium]